VLPPGSNLIEEQRSLLKRMALGLGQIASLIVELEMANRRLRQLSVFYEVGQALVTTFDITNLLAEAMELAANVIDAGAASILLVDETRKELVFRVSHGHRGHMLRQQRIPLDEGIAGWVVKNGLPVIANDARADSRFSHRVDVRTGFLTQSIAAVPLKVKGRIIGVLEVLNKYSGRGFNQEDIQLMSSIAAQAAIAIENSRLYEELRDERDNIIHAHDDFRRDLTRKLQEGPMQLLSAIGMGLEHLERLNFKANPDIVQNQIGALHNLVRQANKTTHNILFDLYPLILEKEGLIAAVTQLVKQLKSSEKLNIQFRSVEEANYNQKIAGVIFIVIQEALNNAKRHAKAETVWLLLAARGEHFIVTIQDNGQGFDMSQLDGSQSKRLFGGLTNMRELAESIGARFQINSSTEGPKRGTIVQLVLPWPPQSKRNAPA
jgi:signal transduction histidine kinase